MSIAEEDNLSCDEFHSVFIFFLDVPLHTMTEYIAVFHHRQVEVPSVS